MTLRLTLLSCAGTVALMLAGPAFAQTPPAPATPAASAVDSARVVAKVDGQPITEADLAVAAEDPALNLPATDAAQKREILIGYVIDLRLGAKAASVAKIADAPAFQRRLAYLRDKLLVDEYLDRQTQGATTPEAARALYEETVKGMNPEEEVRARHILIEDEEAAKKAYARVSGGEDFAKVAAELSSDPGSKQDGGDLGFFAKDRMVAPFAEAAFTMKPNEISQPVKSQFGWHIIQVLERRTKPVPTFVEMKEQIDQYLVRKVQQDTILALRKSGTVERLEGPGAPPAR